MGRLRFEEQIKTALEEREIKPTEGSWEKLASRLETEEKNSFSLYWWLGIAATIVGAFLIAGMIYNGDPGINSPGIVETPSKEDSRESVPVQNVENLPSERIASENIISEEVPSAYSEKAPSAEPENKIKGKKDETNSAQFATTGENSSEAKENQIAENLYGETNKQIEEYNFPETEIAKETALAAEIEDILDRIAEKEGQSGTVTDAELNALLAEAASQITRKRNIENADVKIDATALLWDVEMEMEHSFRDKVFEVLKEGYLKAKSAVANRNY